MQSDNRIFDDFAKVLNGAAGTFPAWPAKARLRCAPGLRDWDRRRFRRA